ncbi:MAG TPA: hypothetical protein VFS54_04200, partial [Solirubrobacterales bacterium]|nr:hypothetical protein [Solirubrobacterales bacterium]
MTVVGFLSACVCLGVVPVQALGDYEFDPVLSLTGNCSTAAPDPVPDPSCVGVPPAYPPAPDRPSGRFDEARAIAVDTYGNEYVASYAGGDDAEGRIDVFDDEGRFVTEVAAPDAKSIAVDSEGQLYVFQGDGAVVRYAPKSPYEPEAGVIDYEASAITVTSEFFVGALAVDSETNNVYIVAQGVVKRLDSAKNGNGVLETFNLEPPEVRPWTNAIAIDSQRRRIYVSFCKDEVFECGVMVLGADAPHSVLKELDGSSTPAGQFSALFGWLGLAVDEETGDFFVADIEPAKTIYQFDEDFEYVSERPFPSFQGNNSIQIAVSNGEKASSGEPCAYPNPVPPPGSACNRHYLFVPVLDSSGRALAFAPQNKKAPEITGVKASSIGETEAVLKATVAPNGADTNYVFEYTTEGRFEEDGFEGATVAGEGTIPGESLATQVSAPLTGLVPAETYFFRVRAGNEVGEAEEDGQNEGTFTTYDDASGSQGCPNEALRVGPSALLPDCRAYELVTPADTNGRPPKGVGFVGDLFPTVHSSPSGDVVSFKIEGGSLPGSSGVGSFEGDPYNALRTDSGWASVLAGATGAEATVTIPASTSPDQGYSFWSARIEGPLVINGEETSYVRYPDGKSALIGRGSSGTDPKARGRLITEDGGHVVFETDNVTPTQAIQLEPNAPPTGTEAVYDRTADEVTHVVSLLPGDLTPAAGEDADYVGASKDGKGIAFAIGATLYLRVNNETTYKIGEKVDFAGVSEGGARIFYVEGGNLEAFDVASEEVIGFATTGDAVPVNVANDGSRAYFVSPSVLDGENSEGAAAIAPASGQGTLGARGTGTLSAASGKGTLKKGNSDITGLTTEEGEFQTGMQISGPGVPEGTTIEAVESGTLTLSAPVTQSGSSISLTAGSPQVTGVSTSQGVFQPGMQISGTGIPAGTTIAKVGSSTLTLSKAATQSG